MKITCSLYLHYVYTLGLVHRNLSIKETLNIGHLSNEATVCSPKHRTMYKSTSELGTPLYAEQSAGSQDSQWCPLLRGSRYLRTSPVRCEVFPQKTQPVMFDPPNSDWLKSPHSSCLVLIGAHRCGFDNNGCAGMTVCLCIHQSADSAVYSRPV